MTQPDNPTGHAYVHSPDDKYPHLVTAHCRCGEWRTGGSARPYVTRAQYEQHTAAAGGPRTDTLTRMSIGRQIEHAAEVLGITCATTTDPTGALRYLIDGEPMSVYDAAEHLLDGGFAEAFGRAQAVVHPDRLAAATSTGDLWDRLAGETVTGEPQHAPTTTEHEHEAGA